MFEIMGRVFGGGKKHVHRTLRTRLAVEELVPRVLPNASPLSFASHHVSAGSHHLQSTSLHVVSLPKPAATVSPHLIQSGVRQNEVSGEVTLEASLSNATGTTGKAEFNSTSGELEVHVKGAAPSTSLTVAIDGTTVGTLTTDASGNGHLELAQTAVSAKAGSTITVGDLQGTFSTAGEGSGQGDGGNEDSGGEGSNSTELKAQLTGTSGATGHAEFNSSDGQLEVKIKGAAANTTYNVTIDGNVVGQLTTNAFGRGRLELSGVTAQAGSTITVADTAGNPPILQGTFGQSADDD